MKDSLVSIAMATYNGEKYIKQQLDSILKQTYINLEIIICDDLSKDKTVDIIKEYQEKDSRIKLLINERNLGFKKNFEKAISLCRGDFIALSDQDDIWHYDKIKVLVASIGKYSLIHSACSLIDENAKEISPLWMKPDDLQYSFEKLIFGTTITGCTVLFKKELLKDFFPIPNGEKYHDWWLGLLASKSNNIIYYDKVLVQYRQHESQDTGVKLESIVSKVVRYSKSFFIKNRSKRFYKSQQQMARLNSFISEKEDIFSNNEIGVIQDAITYHENYLKHFFHLNNFFISLKYQNSMYPFCRFYIKNILRDILG